LTYASSSFYRNEGGCVWIQLNSVILWFELLLEFILISRYTGFDEFIGIGLLAV